MFTKMLFGTAIALGAVLGAAPAGAITNPHAAAFVTVDNRAPLDPTPVPPPPPGPLPGVTPPAPPPVQAPAPADSEAPADSDWWRRGVLL